jgi:hypothetical protein
MALDSLALRLLFGLACAAPVVLMAWNWRKHPGQGGRWVCIFVLCSFGAMSDPLALALQRVDGVILGKICTN